MSFIHSSKDNPSSVVLKKKFPETRGEAYSPYTTFLLLSQSPLVKEFQLSHSLAYPGFAFIVSMKKW